jgi:hypothetical protein
MLTFVVATPLSSLLLRNRSHCDLVLCQSAPRLRDLIGASLARERASRHYIAVIRSASVHATRNILASQNAKVRSAPEPNRHPRNIVAQIVAAPRFKYCHTARIAKLFGLHRASVASRGCRRADLPSHLALDHAATARRCERGPDSGCRTGVAVCSAHVSVASEPHSARRQTAFMRKAMKSLEGVSPNHGLIRNNVADFRVQRINRRSEPILARVRSADSPIRRRMARVKCRQRREPPRNAWRDHGAARSPAGG